MATREDMAKRYFEESQANEKRDAELAERQLLSGATSILGDTAGALTGTLTGLLGSVAQSVNPNNKRPEPGYKFQAPGPGDSRGPCPGLNLLANYGYLPRNGIVTAGQVLEATARGFNMGADLAAVLITFAVLADGNLATETFALGTSGNGNVGGLNRHSTVEADVSPNREDYYLGCGDNHHLSSRLFKQNIKYVAASATKQFDLNVMGNHFAESSSFSKLNNPFLYYFPFPSIVSFAAFAFYPNFFSNGTYGAGGVANYESISSIIGAKYNGKTNEFQYVPERWPENWYRRSTEYGAVEAITQGLLNIYAKNPIAMPIAQLGTPNLNATTVLCFVYQGLNSITPLFVAGAAEATESALTQILAALDPNFKNTILGCPTSTISNNYLFPNANSTGGPLSPPASVQANTGNNVYNKTYFTTAPTKPQCSHTS
ncbi:hypothetical protein EG328_011775 [Venturia inaequalis]|uniref:Heme haloperoxidase family profile domain-containing protein n=1 Tax=Venturia inaequalis TaxID=5025 RepID=A0A8H3VPN1_VENIN|nr:hypothetical protein EG328_011775 [Venturia inaequalis]KAE9992236.1 hypothetical protein EG327_009734 [Venturia inaequalis]RDI88523.1 hypothetical protein Vi05172_g1571 [Venturia inaequalis]